MHGQSGGRDGSLNKLPLLDRSELMCFRYTDRGRHCPDNCNAGQSQQSDWNKYLEKGFASAGLLRTSSSGQYIFSQLSAREPERNVNCFLSLLFYKFKCWILWSCEFNGVETETWQRGRHSAAGSALVTQHKAGSSAVLGAGCQMSGPGQQPDLTISQYPTISHRALLIHADLLE